MFTFCVRHQSLFSCLLLLAHLGIGASLAAAAELKVEVNNKTSPPEVTSIEPGTSLDYTPLAFYPRRWTEQKVDTTMHPWHGEQLVFLTNTPKLDGTVMASLLKKLDGGWQLYADLTGQRPRINRQVDGKPVLAAIPTWKLTCGYGCGYVGVTGIELTAFYTKDYQDLQRNAANVPDYYYYEMGRNYYTFGDKHSLFVTGFAVFMRYVCVDKLELQTDTNLRKKIEQAEAMYAETDLPFIKAFTTHDGLSEKQNRLKQLSPSDQPVMYASAMLKLRRDYGGDAWVQRFFKHLAKCPAIKPTDKTTAQQQAINWFVCASAAAGEDLSPVFVDRWRMPLTEKQKRIVAKTDWSNKRINASRVVARLLK